MSKQFAEAVEQAVAAKASDVTYRYELTFKTGNHTKTLRMGCMFTLFGRFGGGSSEPKFDLDSMFWFSANDSEYSDKARADYKACVANGGIDRLWLKRVHPSLIIESWRHAMYVVMFDQRGELVSESDEWSHYVPAPQRNYYDTAWDPC